MSDLQNEYQKLNNSFKESCIYRIGIYDGMFSEVNFMVFAMIYCLENRIRFILYSNYANFADKIGWNKYFLPFCSENYDIFNYYYNFRSTSHLQNLKLKDFITNLYKGLRGVKFLTNEVFDKTMETSYWYFGKFDIKEIGLSGTTEQVGGRIIREIIWHLKSDLLIQIKKDKENIKLPLEYVSLHIRKGDKLTEPGHSSFPSIDDYFTVLEKKRIYCKNIFLLTDDYNVITEIQENYPEYKIFTLCENFENGYDNTRFHMQGKDKIQNEITKLLSSIEIARDSILYVGTKTSNIDYFVSMLIDKQKFQMSDCNQFWPV